MTLLASNFLEQWYLIYWPEEESYSEVPPSKLVKPKKPATGDKVRVKDGTKVHTGEVVGFGSKVEIEKLMLDLEGRQDDDKEEAANEGEQSQYFLYVGNIETPAEVFDLTGMANISSTISTPSSVPLPLSPVKMGDPNKESENLHQLVDPFTLEMEVQELIDRVTIKEGHKHMFEA